MLIKLPKPWDIPDADVTPEDVYLNRRAFVRQLLHAGVGVGAMATVGCETAPSTRRKAIQKPRSKPCTDPWSCGLDPSSKGFVPTRRNPRYRASDRAITSAVSAAAHNNFYEFTTNKAAVWRRVGQFKTADWKLEVTGLCKKPMVFDMDDLRTLPHEERVYRFRCVERWAMVVPWTGFRLRDLLKRVEPLSSAKWVRFVSFSDPKQMPGVRSQPYLNWPYYEGLRMDEARHNLTLMVTGMYGRPLPRQNGAPLRLIVPWKYGYKSAKSIVRIELVDKRPHTFWNDLQPAEYGFFSNVDPNVPHPRWLQRSETLIGVNKRVKTLPYNGYAQSVASMY